MDNTEKSSNNNDMASQESSPMSLDYSPLSLANITQTTLTQQTPCTSKDRPPKNFKKLGDLRCVEEIPSQYRHIFSKHPYFNFIQSQVLDHVLYSDANIVLSAPTGSGKTVIFELAIIHLLVHLEDNNYMGDFKIIYVAPIKALCTERLCDWHKKFSEIGLPCIEVTSDTERLEIRNLEQYKIIITTPEKWDSLTRKWKDNKAIVKMVKLFMIDEIHLLNDKKRGPTLEAIISRMKTIQDTLALEPNGSSTNFNIRFIGVSATINNIQDIAKWLGRKETPALSFRFGDEYRPVNLQKVVLGYPVSYNSTPYKFDMSLNYKLAGIIMQYSHNKPTLVFCTTRKGMLQTANILKMSLTFRFSDDQKNHIYNLVEDVVDATLRELLMVGIGWHNAGMQPTDREITETLFRAGLLPVLLTTSTLAMGVNLPAHLVIIKSTEMYKTSGFEEYDEISLLQMIGRAGRPQYDTSAVAVIMTKYDSKSRYENLVTGQAMIESNLHRHLSEYLNAEVVLHTVTDLAVAMDWIRTTFLYVRSLRNPKYYGFQEHWSKYEIENKLQELCEIEIRKLEKFGLVKIDQVQGIDISPTIYGQLMARYYIAFETMQLFSKVQSNEFLSRILAIVCQAAEFSDISLRVNDKKTLNALNNPKNEECIRFPLPGKIKSVDMKINCLIQAVCGSLKIVDSTLRLESVKIMRIAERITSCLCNYLNVKNQYFEALKNTIILAKCLRAHLWENSAFVSRQLDKIGPVFSQLLADAGKTTFQALLETSARDLERITNRGATFGNHIIDLVKHLPVYAINVELSADLTKDNMRLAEITVKIVNLNDLKDKSTTGRNHVINVLIGDSENNTLLYEKISDENIINNDKVAKYFPILLDYEHEVHIYVISDNWVGLDFHQSVAIPAANPQTMPHASTTTKITAKILPNNVKITRPMSPLQLSAKNSVTLGTTSTIPKIKVSKKSSETTRSASPKKKNQKSNLTNRRSIPLPPKEMAEKTLTNIIVTSTEKNNDDIDDLTEISQIPSSLDPIQQTHQKLVSVLKANEKNVETPPTLSLKEEILCNNQSIEAWKTIKRPKTVTFLVDNEIVTPEKSVSSINSLEEIEIAPPNNNTVQTRSALPTPAIDIASSVSRLKKLSKQSNRGNEALQVLNRIISTSEQAAKTISVSNELYQHKKLQTIDSGPKYCVDLRSFCKGPKAVLSNKIKKNRSNESTTPVHPPSQLPTSSEKNMNYPTEYIENIIDKCWNRNESQKAEVLPQSTSTMAELQSNSGTSTKLTLSKVNDEQAANESQNYTHKKFRIKNNFASTSGNNGVLKHTKDSMSVSQTQNAVPYNKNQSNKSTNSSKSSNDKLPTIISDKKVDYPQEYIDNIINKCWNRTESKKADNDFPSSVAKAQSALPTPGIDITASIQRIKKLSNQLNRGDEALEVLNQIITTSKQAVKAISTNDSLSETENICTPSKPLTNSASEHTKDIRSFSKGQPAVMLSKTKKNQSNESTLTSTAKLPPATLSDKNVNYPKDYAENKSDKCWNRNESERESQKVRLQPPNLGLSTKPTKVTDDFPTLKEISQIYDNIFQMQQVVSNNEIEEILHSNNERKCAKNQETVYGQNEKSLMEFHFNNMDTTNNDDLMTRKNLDMGEKEFVESFIDAFTPTPPDDERFEVPESRPSQRSQKLTIDKGFLSQFTDAGVRKSTNDLKSTRSQFIERDNESKIKNETLPGASSNRGRLNESYQKSSQALFENRLSNLDKSQHLNRFTSLNKENIPENDVALSQNRFDEQFPFCSFGDSSPNGDTDWESYAQRQSVPSAFNVDQRNYTNNENVMADSQTFEPFTSRRQMPAPRNRNSNEELLTSFNYYHKRELFFEEDSDPEAERNFDLFMRQYEARSRTTFHSENYDFSPHF